MILEYLQLLVGILPYVSKLAYLACVYGTMSLAGEKVLGLTGESVALTTSFRATDSDVSGTEDSSSCVTTKKCTI